jgi:CDP-diacylglycerol---glycerol-3-phosphate 3-phosphatidyltransferase
MLDGRWRASVERGLEPVGKGLQRAGMNADVLTLIGLGFAVATAFLIAQGYLVLAVVGVILTGVPDILDGTVARHSGKAGPRGAFLDSVCDRISDAVLFGGVAWRLAAESPRLPVLVLAAAVLSMLISYERAKAESLGFVAKGGIMERAERMVLLSVGLAFDILVPMLWVMVALTALTAVHRFLKVWGQATPAREHPARVASWRLQRRRHGRAASAELDGVELSGAATPGRLAGWWAARTARAERWGWRQSRGRSTRRRTRP